MFRPRRRTNDGSSLVTIVVVVVVIAGTLGWAIYESQYESQEPVSVREVPTETITVPPADTK